PPRGRQPGGKHGPARTGGLPVLSPGCLMTRQLACSFAALLMLALPGSAMAGHAPSGAPDVEILVNGVPQARYAHDGRWYVEALKGREYAIRLRNPYPVRVAVALSVDGLNTIDARESTASAAPK